MKNRIYRNELLYFSWDTFSHVMRMTIKLKEDIDADILNDAVQSASKRYPYFCIKAVRHDEDYDILNNDLPIVVKKGKDALALGSKEANFHFWAVSYDGCEIVCDASHNLTDGYGTTELCKTILYLYLKKKTGKDLKPDNIRIPGEDFLLNEQVDPYSLMDLENAVAPLTQTKHAVTFVPDKRYATDERRMNYVMRVSVEDTMHVAKTQDGSPAVVLSYFVKEAIKRLFPEREGKTIVCGIPHSFRHMSDLKHNSFNDSVVLSLVYDDRIEAMDVDKQFTCSRGRISLQTDPENILYTLHNRALFAESLDELPTIESRRQACKDSVEVIIKNPETAAVSYVGQTKWGSIEEYIDGISFYCGALSAPVLIEVLTLNGWFYMTMMLNQTSDRFAETIVDILNENGIRSEYLYSFDNILCTVRF